MRTVIAAALVALAAGCASAPAPSAQGANPTHYWQASERATDNRYRVDNLACQTRIQADHGASVFEPGSDAFDSYQDCMVSRGYTLRQY